MTMFLLCAVLLVLSFGHCGGQCVESIRDFSAAISAQFDNVEFGANQNCKKNGHYSPVSTIISEDLKSDLCDLETIVNEVVNKTASCPGCDPLDLTCTYVKSDVVLVIDTSASLDDDEYAITIDFVVDLLDQMAMADVPDTFRVAAVFYSYESVLKFDLSKYINDLPSAANDIRSHIREEDNTNLYKALDIVKTSVFGGNPGDRDDVPDVLMMLTDGQSTSVLNTYISHGELLVALPDLRYISIGSKKNLLNETEMEYLASDPVSENLFIFDSVAELNMRVREVMGTLCVPCDPECQNGGECIKNTNTCVCQDGFVGSRCQTPSLCSLP